MRVAIPTFGEEISPRFCFAKEMLVIDLADDQELLRDRITLGNASWPERFALLRQCHVEVLLCGGFPRQFLPVTESAGIRVIVGLVGAVEDVVKAFCKGRIDELQIMPCIRRSMDNNPQTSPVFSNRSKRTNVMTAPKYIAVAVESDGGLDALVSSHFGHCAGFLVVEVMEGEIRGQRMVPNPFFHAHQPGALPKVVEGLGAQVLLAGGMGPRAQAMISRFGVEVATGATGCVRDAVNAFLRGDLRGFTPCADHGQNGTCGRHHN